MMNHKSKMKINSSWVACQIVYFFIKTSKNIGYIYKDSTKRILLPIGVDEIQLQSAPRSLESE